MATTIRTPPSTTPVAWDLAENAAMRVSRRGAAVVVRVKRGTVLVTQRGDVEDHVLEPGEELGGRGGAGRGAAVRRQDRDRGPRHRPWHASRRPAPPGDAVLHHSRGEGTGLGVLLARSVIAQHGGTLRYESAPGKGTTARATLPAAYRAA